MSRVSIDSTLMQQMLPASKLNASKDFKVVLDQHDHPMIFSIGYTGDFCLTMENESGFNTVVDLNTKFEIDKSTSVSAFYVSQDLDRKIYLVFAYGRDTNSQSTIDVMHPWKPDEIDWAKASLRKDWIYTADKQENIVVDSFYVGAADITEADLESGADQKYPLIGVEVRVIDDAYTKDLWIFAPDQQKRSWKFEKDDLQLPFKPRNLKAFCTGREVYDSEVTDGIFVVSVDKDETYKISFVKLRRTEDSSFLTLSELVGQPPQPCTLATIREDNGSTGLLVGTIDNGVWHYSSAAAFGEKPPVQVDTNARNLLLNSLQSMSIAQDIHDSFRVSLWALNTSNTICYQELKLTPGQSLDLVGETYQLLDADSGGGKFYPIRMPLVGQVLFVQGQDKQLRYIEQDEISRIWQTFDVKVPDPQNNIEFTAYTTTIRVKDERGVPNSFSEVSISCSMKRAVIINGKSLRIHPDGINIKTDASGTITIITETEDMGAPMFTLKDAQGSKSILGDSPYEIDPAFKLTQKLMDVKTVDDLKNTGLVPPTASQEDLENTLKTLQQLVATRENIKGGSVTLKRTKMSALRAGGSGYPGTAEDDHETAEVSAAQRRWERSSVEQEPLLYVHQYALFEGVFDDVVHIVVKSWDASKYVMDKVTEKVENVAKEVATAAVQVVNTTINTVSEAAKFVTKEVVKAVEWTVEKVKEGVAIAIKIGKDKLAFVVDTLAKVGKAVWTVLKTVGSAIEKAIKFIGHLFEWGDILDTKNMLVTTFNSGILFAIDGCSYMEKNLPYFIESIKRDLGTIDPKEYKNHGFTTKSDKDNKAKDAVDSPEGSYGSYHAEHSGQGLADREESSVVQSIASSLLSIGEEIQKLLKNIFNDFGRFVTDDDFSFEDFIGHLKNDLINGALDIVGKLFAAILEILRPLLIQLAKAANEPIYIPVLSSLYKKISGGSSLTVLDATCLILAIPITIVVKLFTDGKGPAEGATAGGTLHGDWFAQEIQKRIDQPMLKMSHQMARSTNFEPVPLSRESLFYKTCVYVADHRRSIGEVTIGYIVPIGAYALFVFKTVPGWRTPLNLKKPVWKKLASWLPVLFTMPLKVTIPDGVTPSTLYLVDVPEQDLLRWTIWSHGIVAVAIESYPNRQVQAGVQCVLGLSQFSLTQKWYDIHGTDKVTVWLGDSCTSLGKIASAVAKFEEGLDLNVNAGAIVLVSASALFKLYNASEGQAGASMIDLFNG